MSDTREKLIELLNGGELEAEVMCSTQTDCDKCPNARNGCQERTVAEYLLANGVTVQEWVPVSEPPKEWKHKNGVAINFLVYTPEYGIDIGNYLKPANAWLCMGIPCNATHWMPLPEPPKGE